MDRNFDDFQVRFSQQYLSKLKRAICLALSDMNYGDHILINARQQTARFRCQCGAGAYSCTYWHRKSLNSSCDISKNMPHQAQTLFEQQAT